MFKHKKINTPVGPLHLVSTGTELAAVVFESSWSSFIKKEKWQIEDGTDAVINNTENQLAEYFTGRRSQFDIPLYFSGTAFQKAAWKSLLSIPFGETFSYSEQARNLNKPAAARAIGAANGKNKICIIVPCHRVIGKNGALTGFSGGVEVKKQLLRLEGCDLF